MNKQPISSKVAMRLPAIALPYAVTSVLRGGKRSLVVPLLFIGMVIFICVFVNMRVRTEEEIEATYREYPLIMRFTDITGKKFEGFFNPYNHWEKDLLTSDLKKILETGFVYRIYFGYNTWPTTILTERFEGFPQNESREDRERFAEQWIMESFLTSSAYHCPYGWQFAPEFAFGAAPEITWDPNWSRNDGYTHGYVVSEAVLERYNISVGDTVYRFTLHPENYIEDIRGTGKYFQYERIIRGSFANETNEPRAYYVCNVPCEYPKDHVDYLLLYDFQFDFITIWLTNKRQLSEFKDWLELNFNQIGQDNGFESWVVIDDAAFYATMDSLERYLGYLNMFYPIILGMVVGIGFLVSHLLLKSRAGEIAVLRGLGTRKHTVFFAYFNEQFILSLLGIAVGLGIAIPVLGGLSAIDPLNVLLLCGCYYAGLALAITQTYRKSAMKSLQMKEE
jgi:hypothetical protein